MLAATLTLNVGKWLMSLPSLGPRPALGGRNIKGGRDPGREQQSMWWIQWIPQRFVFGAYLQMWTIVGHFTRSMVPADVQLQLFSQPNCSQYGKLPTVVGRFTQSRKKPEREAGRRYAQNVRSPCIGQALFDFKVTANKQPSCAHLF